MLYYVICINFSLFIKCCRPVQAMSFRGKWPRGSTCNRQHNGNNLGNRVCRNTVTYLIRNQN